MTAEDLDGLYRLYEDPAAVRYMKGFSDDREEEREKLLSYIEKVYGFYGYGYWAVVLKNSGDLIGRVGFGKPEGDGHDASVGYLIRKDKRHQGYGFEVTQAALEYAFHAIGMSAIDAVTDPENTASVSLLKKLGFSEETMQEGENHDQSALFVYARQ